MQSLNKIVEEQWKSELCNSLKKISDYNINQRMINSSNFKLWQKPPENILKLLLSHPFFPLTQESGMEEQKERFGWGNMR